MVKNSLYLIILLIQTTVFSQSNSIYSELEVIKNYQVDLNTSERNNNKTYRVNGEKVSRLVYRKYDNANKNFEKCTPCILQYYNKNDILLSEGVYHLDCRVGYYKEFYPNGALKTSGQYKENDTADWTNIYDRGYCFIKDGQWNFYNENGKIKYTEIWKDNKFIKQEPESGLVEIWKVDLFLNDTNIYNKRITIDEFSHLQIIPRYKNSLTSSNIRLKVNISSPGLTVPKEFYLSDLPKMDISGSVDYLETSNIENVRISIMVMDGNKTVGFFNLKLKK